MLASYVSNRASVIALQLNRPLVLCAVPYILSFSLFMILAGLTLPRSSDYLLIYYFALWFTLVVFSTILMLIHGLDHVAWPRLIPLTGTTYYRGPGFRPLFRGTGFGVNTQPLVLRATPYILSFSLFMILAGLTLPRSSDYSLIYYFALWFTLVVISTIFMFIHGPDYVALLRLPLTEAIHYGGPGFRSSHHGTGFGVYLSKLKPSANAQSMTKGIRLLLKLRLATRNVFKIFGSRPDPSYPNGAGMIVIPQLSMQTEIAELRSQNEFDEEDRAISAQPAELAKSIQRLFECGICMEEMPDDLIARPDPCGHTFCRECLRGHVTARLNEHRFPIPCPICTAGKGKGKEAAGEVSQSLVLDLGLTEEQYNIWTEMELASFSILLFCRKCERTMFVARDDHEEAKIISCPLPDCNHVWCKQCQRSVDFIGPKHSCDGTSELDHLMKQQGWKYCPTCKTPIQKISGCNHMSCRTPACNTHFCYICGGLIVKSASGQEITKATSAHYRENCTLFEVPE